MNFLFNNEVFQIVETTYHDGNIAVRIADKNAVPYATISVNLPESKNLPKGYFYIKDWSENRELVSVMYALGILQRSFDLAPVASGFIVAYAGRIVA